MAFLGICGFLCEKKFKLDKTVRPIVMVEFFLVNINLSGVIMEQ